MSDIRNLLARAQEAENKGRKDEAALFLRKAAAWYRDRQQLRRAGQMLRQARRVEGLEEVVSGDDPASIDESPFGFDEGSADGSEGDDVHAESSESSESFEAPARRRDGRTLVEQRSPQLADPGLDAWCSFCCRPRQEVGALVAGPAGAYVCAGCGHLSLQLLGGQAPPVMVDPVAPSEPATTNPHELPAQRRARERFERARARLTLVLGPEGSGKSAWLRTLGEPMTPPLTQLQGSLLVLEVSAALSEDDEARLLGWLDERPVHRAVLGVRAALPEPVLVLKGEAGDEPLYDTAGLGQSVSHLSARVLGRVDAVLGLESPDEAALEALAAALAEGRGVSLPVAALRQLVGLAHRSGRGAHELAALVGRIPPGRYTP